ncbi:P-loop NTPase fold protein [Limnofasciculus baicalensis]|uniref:ATP-binding protein n=1 Tax=Limnofasciculus baicalensis BBK-W-15 TaxID=2699891 RepID=A0AAE3KKD6_9CYAN|nr:P-loop NTPase fold protein [Limnofasciculus baicalensis]MCP2727455.1 ATP-binding protein [Limnofasciculus baicalensis BBK-W-15]
MENPPVSPIEVLNAAIQSHNPFINAGIVKEQDVWGNKFTDVPTLNSHASDAVFQAIKQVRTSQSSQDKVTSIAITAQQGVGKTHLLSRIRHRLEREGGALFVYAGVNNYTDLNLVKYQFQQTLADSLSHTASQEVMQWQEVAAAIANEGFKAINPNAPNLSPQELTHRFDKVSASWVAKNKSLMNVLTKQVLKTKQNADPYIIRAILWTLSETQSSFAIKWLSGDELAQSNAEVLGLPNPSKTSQDREAEALKNVQQTLNLVSYYNPVVICFDEIDVKNNSTDDGLPTELVIADLVKRLHDTLENSELSKGVVILTVMLPDTWTQKVNLMPGGTPDRVSKYTQRKPIDLKYISGNSMVELVTLWLKDFYESRNLFPPNSCYPFEESELKKFGKGKPTVREALQWCAENFKVYQPQLPTKPLDRFELALKKEIEADIGDYLEDNSLIADSLRFGFQTLIGKTLEGVTIEEITEVKPKAENKGWINFKVIGTEGGKVVKIGVAVIQSSQFSLVAGLKRLKEYEIFDLTRGCLVRSQSKIEQTKKNSEAYKLLDQLILEKGGEHVPLIEEQIRPLIAVHSVYQKRGNYDLTEEQVFDFISQQQLTFENPLLADILSDPSGRMPAVDERDSMELLEDFLNPSNINETDDSDDLGELFN